MNFQWQSLSEGYPIVEFHDVRTETGGAGPYLQTLDERLAAPLADAGGLAIGQYTVLGHPERLMVIRAFAGIESRRVTLERFHSRREWRAERAGLAELVRDTEVSLTRTIVPAAGLTALRARARQRLMVSELRFSEQVGNYHLWLRLLLRKAGLDPVAAFATLEAVNDVPAVPVLRNRTRHIAMLPPDRPVPDLPAELRCMLRYPPETLTLDPAPALVW
jgi:hypothetical protein